MSRIRLVCWAVGHRRRLRKVPAGQMWAAPPRMGPKVPGPVRLDLARLPHGCVPVRSMVVCARCGGWRVVTGSRRGTWAYPRGGTLSG